MNQLSKQNEFKNLRNHYLCQNLDLEIHIYILYEKKSNKFN